MGLAEWKEMSNEELCLEYQSVPSDALYEYFLSKNDGLMRHYYNKFTSRYPDIEDDFVQGARLAVWHTMKRLDPSKGNFSTLFHWWIKRELLTVWRRFCFDVILPRRLLWDLETVKNDPNIVYNVTSLSYENDECDTELIDSIVDVTSPSVEELAERQDQHEYIKGLINRLNPREQRIIRLRLGFNKENKTHTLNEIGERYGVCRERIRQIEVQAFKKIKMWINKEGWYDKSDL